MPQLDLREFLPHNNRRGLARSSVHVGGIHMECARQGCDKEAIAGSNYCKAHFDLDKANVDKEEEEEGGGEGGEGSE